MQRQTQFSETASASLGCMIFGIGGLSAPLTTALGQSLLSMSFVILDCYVFAGLFYLWIRYTTKTIKP